MPPRRSSGSAPVRSVRRFALAALLGGILLFALTPRVASATQVQGLHPQVTTGPSMAPHAPVEVPVSAGLRQVLEGLLCQCGCNLDAYDCQQTMTCNVSTDMWAQAEELVDRQGRTPAQALQLFATDYGEYVLAAPLKRGFNLAAWILPLVGMVLGAVVIAFALRTWRPRTAEVPDASPPEIDPRYLDQLERELREDG